MKNELSTISKLEEPINKEGLQLNKIELDEAYAEEWNEHCKDFLLLSMNGEILRNVLYRKGGLFNGKVGRDKYFLLIKYTEEIYDLNFIKKCYSDKDRKFQDKHRKNLKSQWVIIDSLGNEKVVFDRFDHGYLISPNSCIYSLGSKYYNIETGEFYGDTSDSVQTNEFLFLELGYRNSHDKQGVLKLNKIDGTWELFKNKI